MLTTLAQAQCLLAGESYWKVLFFSGKGLTEYDTKLDFKQARYRKVEWLEDLIAAQDIPNVKEVTLCTPQGEYSLEITEKYTVFQLSRGTMAWDMASGQLKKIKQCQIIGRVDDKLTGTCTAIIWDVELQETHCLHTSVFNFETWRHNGMAIGALNLEALDIRL